jgi:hypothetical protein
MTGLTRQKLGTVFADEAFRNLTLATSNGIVYSWGQNILKAQDRDIESLRSAPDSPDSSSSLNQLESVISDGMKEFTYRIEKIYWTISHRLNSCPIFLFHHNNSLYHPFVTPFFIPNYCY